MTLAVAITVSVPSACSFMDQPIPDAVAWLRGRGWQIDLVDDRYQVSRAGCTDAHLADLLRDEGHLGRIDLTLRGTAVTDAGLHVLGGHPGVLTLDVSGLAITDDGLAVAGNWRELENLYLAGTAITDATLQRLSGLERLRILQLHGCAGLSGNGLGYVSSRHLRWLGLANTRLDDTGLDRLNDKPALATIVLESTSVTLSGIAALKRFDQLQEVYAHGVTDEFGELDNSQGGEIIPDPIGQPAHYRPRTSAQR
ncbi:MAG: hypothetical protein NXI31_00435 [bacterium]|nr:hypothetical protein [bacterium]